MNLSVTHRGTLRVAAAPHHAFQLFTAPGERLWIDDWDPAVLRGADHSLVRIYLPRLHNIIKQ